MSTYDNFHMTSDKKIIAQRHNFTGEYRYFKGYTIRKPFKNYKGQVVPNITIDHYGVDLTKEIKESKLPIGFEVWSLVKDARVFLI